MIASSKRAIGQIQNSFEFGLFYWLRHLNQTSENEVLHHKRMHKKALAQFGKRHLVTALRVRNLLIECHKPIKALV